MDNVEAKYEVYALSALVHGSITGISSVNPSSLLKVCMLIEQRAEELLDALVDGKDTNLLKGTASILPSLRSQLLPYRKASLSQVLDKDGTIPPDILWPKLSALVTWTGGSCGIALEKLKSYLPLNVNIVEMGYSCSEFNGTVNIDIKRNTCLPLLTDNFYEFVAKEDWESNSPKFLLLNEIDADKDYYIFVTTASGLYRYDINDVVRATDGVGNCPGLRFVRKGKGMTNITGEKISEDQAIAAVSYGLKSAGYITETFLVLAEEDASTYRIFVESSQNISVDLLSEKIEGELRKRNAEYDDKRASGRLNPVEVERLFEGAGEAIKTKFLQQGVRETQYKPPVLAYWNEWEEWIGDWTEGPTS